MFRYNIGVILYELKCRIMSSFTELKVLFSPTTCNRIAHAVTARGISVLKVLPCSEGLEDLVANILQSL